MESSFEKHKNDVDARVAAEFSKFESSVTKKIGDRLRAVEASFTRCGLQMEEFLLPRLLASMAGYRWLLSHGIKLAVVKSLTSPEYLRLFGKFVSAALNKGLHEGLMAGIEHVESKRDLSQSQAYNPNAAAEYTSVSQELRDYRFPLFEQLSAVKDASIGEMMDFLRLDDRTAEKLLMSNDQPHEEQLSIPVRNPLSREVIGSRPFFAALSKFEEHLAAIREGLDGGRSLLGDAFNVLRFVYPTELTESDIPSASSLSAVGDQPLSIDDLEHSTLLVGSNVPSGAGGGGDGVPANYEDLQHMADDAILE